MNSLIITGSFYPAQEGGPTNAVYWLASGLASSGYNVRILATDKNLEGQYPSDRRSISIRYLGRNERI